MDTFCIFGCAMIEFFLGWYCTECHRIEEAGE
jgi:hypothetical protein